MTGGHPSSTIAAPASDSGAKVAQLVEHVTENHGVGGSIPPLGTILLRADALRRIAALTIAKQDALRSLLAAEVRLRTKAAGGMR